MPKEVYHSGALGDDYPDPPEAVPIDNVEKVLIFIKNTHGSNGMKVKILAYANLDDKTNTVHTILAETTLAAGKTIKDVIGHFPTITDPWNAVAVPAKNAVAESIATAVIVINSRR